MDFVVLLSDRAGSVAIATAPSEKRARAYINKILTEAGSSEWDEKRKEAHYYGKRDPMDHRIYAIRQVPRV